jgi:hypothetical protein
VSLLAWIAALGMLQDPAGRLLDAVERADPAAAREALASLAREDGPRAARAVASALGRFRERQAAALNILRDARREVEDLDASFCFGLGEERAQNRRRAEAVRRVTELTRRAVDGEIVYHLLRESLRPLAERAPEDLDREARRSASWVLKSEIYEALAEAGARLPLEAALEREREPVVLAAIVPGLGPRAAAAFLEHPFWQVREAAIRGLAGSPESVPRLVEVLATGDLRLRDAAHRALEALTGARLPPDVHAWRAWRESEGGPARRSGSEGGAREPSSRPGVTTAFYDVPVASSRLCFVLDRSLSMREEGRFEAARRELKRLLGALPDGTRVNILFFGAGVSSFAGALRPLDAQARRDASDFVDRQVPDARGTDLYGALEKALLWVGNPDSGTLREEGADTIVLLSDGRPTVGRVVDEELVGRVVARRARPLRPVFHAVQLGMEAPMLRRLAERTGGRYLRLP